MRRNIVTGLLAITLLMALTATAIAGNEYLGFPVVKIKVDGQELNPDVPALIVNGRTLLPVRALTDALGARITWDASTQTVAVESNLAELAALRQRVATLEKENASLKQAAATNPPPAERPLPTQPVAPPKTAPMTVTRNGSPISDPVVDQNGVLLAGIWDAKAITGALMAIKMNGDLVGSVSYIKDGQIVTFTESGAQRNGEALASTGFVRDGAFSPFVGVPLQTLVTALGGSFERTGNAVQIRLKQAVGVRQVIVQQPGGARYRVVLGADDDGSYGANDFDGTTFYTNSSLLGALIAIAHHEQTLVPADPQSGDLAGTFLTPAWSKYAFATRSIKYLPGGGSAYLATVTAAADGRSVQLGPCSELSGQNELRDVTISLDEALTKLKFAERYAWNEADRTLTVQLNP